MAKSTTRADAPKAPTASYTVIDPLKFDGDDYAVGDTVELTEAQAAPLLGTVVKPVATEAA
jgi:hypothetical protein